MATNVVARNAGRTILDGFVEFKLFSADTDGALAIVEHVLGPGMLGAPMHTHRNEDEYSYVLEGVITVLIGDELIMHPPARWSASRATSRTLSGIRAASRRGCWR